MTRIAAIDVGTNSIRCIVAEGEPSGRFRVLDDEKATVRLGEGLAATGELSPAAMARGIAALSRMRKIADSCRVGAIEAVATSAVRDAANGGAFVEEVRRETGIDLRVVSGEEEAELAALSAANEFDLEGRSYGVVDVGGGSAEIVVAFGPHHERVATLDLGAVVLTERFLRSDPVKKQEFEALRRHVRSALAETFPDPPPLSFLVGSGGTMNALGNMTMMLRREPYPSVQGYELLHADVAHLLAALRHLDLKWRRKFPGLHADRADIIVAGAAVVEGMMRHFGANLLRINERGVREGLILRGLRLHGRREEEARPWTWRESVIRFAESCRFDERHALQVARLALAIFEAVVPSTGLGEPERRILESAALLHDVGYLVSYPGHHKHSSLLIRHAELFGFTPRERELVALIARYHRKALPRKKHRDYARLSAPDRLLVLRLGGILRLADGLDRRRTGAVTGIGCIPGERTFTILAEGDDDLSVELFGGREKGMLFERAFGVGLVLAQR